MTYSPQNSISPFINENIYLPEDDDQKNIYTTTLLRDIAVKLNFKEIANYELIELLTGQAWFLTGDDSIKRATFRKAIQFPSLTAIGTTSVAHGLGDISGFTFTKILGTARNTAGTLHVVLPQGGPDSVMITIDANNINIICATATYNTFSAQIILEYLKN